MKKKNKQKGGKKRIKYNTHKAHNTRAASHKDTANKTKQIETHKPELINQSYTDTSKISTDINNNISLQKVAIVHDFLFQFGGAEKVVERLLKLHPQADLYTSFTIPEKFDSSPVFSSHFSQNKVFTSFIQPLFNIKYKGKRVFQRFQKHFFFIYPLAMRLITVKGYDKVIISSTDCAKHITLIDNKEVIHYCHSPTRYLNGMVPETDRKTLPLILRLIIPLFILWLKPLDHNAVKRLNKHGTIWFANAEYIQRMIWESYLTRSEVVYPPIELSTFLSIPRALETDPDKEYYLSFGRISFHKRIDLAIKACLTLKKRLLIGGTSALESDIDSLKQIIANYQEKTGDTTEYITFLGRVDDQTYHSLLSGAKGFLFPGKEDFGITPIECLAAGVPIIAYKAGGALEYVKHGENGVFFDSQTEESLSKAISLFESHTFNEHTIRESVTRFDGSQFDKVMK